MVRLAVEDLRAGGQLVIFPEGTRTVTPPLNRFRPGRHADRQAGAGADPDRLHRHRLALPRQGLADLARAAAADRLQPAARRSASRRPHDSDALLTQIEQYFRHTHGTARRRRAARMPDALAHPPCPDPELQHGRAPVLDRRSGPRAMEPGVGGDRRQHRRHRRAAGTADGADRPRPARLRAAAQPGQGRGRAARPARGARRRLHACARPWIRTASIRPT